MPGTLVLMGLYGPRISMGAFGFMSQVSSCEGPPTSISMMQLMSDLSLSTSALRLQPEELRQAQAERGERSGMQKIAPPQPIAELDGPVGIQTKHSVLPNGKIISILAQPL